MADVVRVIGPAGQIPWLTGPKVGGIPAFGSREVADACGAAQDAEAAIAKLPSVYGDSGLIDSIESAG